MEEVIKVLKKIEKQLEIANTDENMKLYTIKDICDKTGIGHSTVYAFFNNKNKYPDFPGFKAGKKYLVEVKKFNNWLATDYAKYRK